MHVKTVYGRLVKGRLVNGRLVKGRLANGRLVKGQLVKGRLVKGRLVNGRLIKDGRFYLFIHQIGNLTPQIEDLTSPFRLYIVHVHVRRYICSLYMYSRTCTTDIYLSKSQCMS